MNSTDQTPNQLAAAVVDDCSGDMRVALLLLAKMVITARAGMSAGMIRLEPNKSGKKHVDLR
jgi:hypothetical protein